MRRWPWRPTRSRPIWSPVVWMSASATPRALTAFTIAAIRALAARRAAAEVGARRSTPALKSAMSGTSVAVPMPSAAIVGVVSVCAAAGAARRSAAARVARAMRMPVLLPRNALRHIDLQQLAALVVDLQRRVLDLVGVVKQGLELAAGGVAVVVAA